MEWSSDLPFSPMDESLYGLLSSPLEIPKPCEWTSEENKVFENALAELDPSSPSFFEDITSKLPWKSVDDIKLHYQALVSDVEMIESGNFPVPDYPTFGKPDDKKEVDSSPPEAKAKNGQPRRRGVPWTEEEHQLFLMGLNKYGKGDWRSISRYYVITKTPTQVASHAQKYFRRQSSSTPVDRRRPSIHDIHTVCPPSTSSFTPQYFPFSPSGLNPGLHHSFNGGRFPAYLPPVNPAFPAAANPVFNQTAPSAYPPSFGNQNWG